jgi:hypothetical protein
MSQSERQVLECYKKRLIAEIAYTEDLRDRAELDTTWDLFSVEVNKLQGRLEAVEEVIELLGREV